LSSAEYWTPRQDFRSKIEHFARNFRAWLVAMRPAIDGGEGLLGEAPANTDSFSRKLFWTINETLGEEMKNSLWDQRPFEIFKNSLIASCNSARGDSN
jgi:hypothetical protein